MIAKWGIDYDSRNDMCYPHPCCPKCGEIVLKNRNDDGYHCISCGIPIELEPDMEKWFKKREGKKVRLEDCWNGCGGKKCVEVVYVRNKHTLKWQCAGGKCRKCGMHFIV